MPVPSSFSSTSTQRPSASVAAGRTETGEVFTLIPGPARAVGLVNAAPEQGRAGRKRVVGPRRQVDTQGPGRLVGSGDIDVAEVDRRISRPFDPQTAPRAHQGEAPERPTPDGPHPPEER